MRLFSRLFKKTSIDTSSFLADKYTDYTQRVVYRSPANKNDYRLVIRWGVAHHVPPTLRSTYTIVRGDVTGIKVEMHNPPMLVPIGVSIVSGQLLSPDLGFKRTDNVSRDEAIAMVKQWTKQGFKRTARNGKIQEPFTPTREV